MIKQNHNAPKHPQAHHPSIHPPYRLIYKESIPFVSAIQNLSELPIKSVTGRALVVLRVERATKFESK